MEKEKITPIAGESWDFSETNNKGEHT